MSDVICPGQRALFSNDGSSHYLRAVFTVYWQNAMPSTEVFYLHEHPFRLSITGITALQDEILAAIKVHATEMTAPIRAIYLGYEGIEMTPKDVADAGWRVLTPVQDAA